VETNVKRTGRDRVNQAIEGFARIEAKQKLNPLTWVYAAGLHRRLGFEVEIFIKFDRVAAGQVAATVQRVKINTSTGVVDADTRGLQEARAIHIIKINLSD